MKYVLLVLSLTFLIVPASADYKIGIDGNLWEGNSSIENTTIVQSTGRVELQDAVPDFEMKLRCDEGTGTIAHDENSTNNNSGIFVGTPTWNSSGKYGYGIAFDGIADYLNCGNDSSISDISTAITMSLWVRPGHTYQSEPDGWQYVIRRLSAGSQYEFGWAGWADNLVWKRSTGIEASYFPVLNESEWYHLAATYDSSGTKIYENGILVANDSDYASISTGGTTYIAGDTAGNYFDATLNDIRIYSRILSTTEINQTRDNHHENTGNLTTWYNASSGYETYELWFNFSSIQNHSDYYRDNNTGSYILLGANQVGNKSYTLSTKYQDTQSRTVLHGNTTGTPELISIEFKTQSTAGSVAITYYNLNYSNLTANVLINISNKTGVLNYINLTHIGNLSSEYCLNYPNGTLVQSCITCTNEGDTIWFNGSADRLPELNVYYINETLGQSTMTIPANSWGMFNNWTSAMTFAGIAANESNDICYTYYNVASGLWESYYVGYSWNANYQLSKDASVMGYFNAQTDITSNIITPSSTELYTGWNMLGIQSSSNQTISGIITDIGANCSDSWYFNSSTGGYSNTTTHSIQPNQGYLAYITQNMTWTRSAM